MCAFIEESAGVSRIFRLREVVPLDERDTRAARTYNIPLRHNSVSFYLPKSIHA